MKLRNKKGWDSNPEPSCCEATALTTAPLCRFCGLVKLLCIGMKLFMRLLGCEAQVADFMQSVKGNADNEEENALMGRGK